MQLHDRIAVREALESPGIFRRNPRPLNDRREEGPGHRDGEERLGARPLFRGTEVGTGLSCSRRVSATVAGVAAVAAGRCRCGVAAVAAVDTTLADAAGDAEELPVGQPVPVRIATPTPATDACGSSPDADDACELWAGVHCSWNYLPEPPGFLRAPLLRRATGRVRTVSIRLPHPHERRPVTADHDRPAQQRQRSARRQACTVVKGWEAEGASSATSASRSAWPAMSARPRAGGTSRSLPRQPRPDATRWPTERGSL